MSKVDFASVAAWIHTMHSQSCGIKYCQLLEKVMNHDRDKNDAAWHPKCD